MNTAKKAIEKAQKNCKKLAEKYNVSETAIVWMGGDKFIVVKNGQEIMIS